MPTELLIVGAVVLLLTALVLARGRSRRDDALAPVRLGPAWSPTEDVTASSVPAPDPEQQASRAARVADRAGVSADVAAQILAIWDEYLTAIGVRRGPVTGRGRIYDPYDPPVVQRDDDGQPVPDRGRVARDVATRLGVAEPDVHAVLAAEAETVGPGDAQAS